MRWFHRSDDTVGLAVPGSDVALMIDRVAPGAADGPGPMFLADSLEDFLAGHPDLSPASGPVDIPDGSLAGFRDPVVRPRPAQGGRGRCPESWGRCR
jgi:hypothetical protein